MALTLDIGFQEHAAESSYADASASNNDATLSGGTAAEYAGIGAGGAFGYAINGMPLDNTSNAWILASEISIGAAVNRTFQGWFKRYTTNPTDILFYDSSILSNVYFNSGTEELTVVDQTGTVGTLDTGVTTTNWHYYGLVFKSDGDIDLYVGPLAGSASLVGTIGTRTDTIAINSSSTFLGRYFGWKVYDEIRSAGQITTDMALGSAPAGGRRVLLDLLGLFE